MDNFGCISFGVCFDKLYCIIIWVDVLLSHLWVFAGRDNCDRPCAQSPYTVYDTQCHTVSHSATQCQTVPHSVTQCHTVTRCHTVTGPVQSEHTKVGEQNQLKVKSFNDYHRHFSHWHKEYEREQLISYYHISLTMTRNDGEGKEDAVYFNSCPHHCHCCPDPCFGAWSGALWRIASIQLKTL